MHFLVTAGPTREYLDDVRYLSNASSGRMGYAVAAAARSRGHRVTLVSGPVELVVPPGVRVLRVTGAREMRRATLREFRRCDVLVMTAAVSDYRPAARLRGKIKKGRPAWSLRLVRTPDILTACAARKRGRICVGFALESRGLRRYALEKLRKKNLDMIVADSPTAIGRPAAAVLCLDRTGRDLWRLHASKAAIARRLVRTLEARAAAAGPAPRG
ncbi:MAG: phosphopantothenoylcysteine decarboxylase [Planctomycetes bacterium]|nr:phosphopantothenoylcysteine decarboxylase [Planctomycetota bacterium]